MIVRIDNETHLIFLGGNCIFVILVILSRPPMSRVFLSIYFGFYLCPSVICYSFFLFFFLFFFFKFIYLFYLWLCWVFVSVRGPSLVVAIGGHSSSRCAGLSLSWPPLLRSTGSRRTGSVVVAHGPSRSAACGILPDQGPNPSPLHWQADSQPLRHQGSPCYSFYIKILHIFLYIYYSCLIVFAGILNTFCWYSKQLVILNNFFTALLNKVTLFFFFFC